MTYMEKESKQEWAYIYGYTQSCMGFPVSSDGKEAACSAGGPASIPGSGRSPGEGNGSPLQFSCLQNPMDRGGWQATVHGVTKGRKLLRDFTSFTTYRHALKKNKQTKKKKTKLEAP